MKGEVEQGEKVENSGMGGQGGRGKMEVTKPTTNDQSVYMKVVVQTFVE
jgi:hypothetical protein